MVLDIDNCNEVVDIMLEKMSKFGINYKISKNVLGPRSGSIPKTDIDNVENAIKEMESQIDSDPDMASIEYLMDLYSKAIEFYSATNNPKYEYYKEKIHNTLSTPRITDYLESESSFRKEENEIDKINNWIDNSGVLEIKEDKDRLENNDFPINNIQASNTTIDKIQASYNTKDYIEDNNSTKDNTQDNNTTKDNIQANNTTKDNSIVDKSTEINNVKEGVKIELSNDDEKVEFDDDEDIDDE